MCMPMMVLFRSDPCQQDERGVVLHLQREEDDLPRGPLVPVPLFNEELIVLLVTSSRKCWARQFFQPASSSLNPPPPPPPPPPKTAVVVRGQQIGYFDQSSRHFRQFWFFIFFGGGGWGSPNIFSDILVSFSPASAQAQPIGQAKVAIIFPPIFFFSLLTKKPKKISAQSERARERTSPKTMNLVATSFATQPVCNAVRAARTLRSDHNSVNRDNYVCHAAGLQRCLGSTSVAQ
jgi:hypothetical protein